MKSNGQVETEAQLFVYPSGLVLRNGIRFFIEKMIIMCAFLNAIFPFFLVAAILPVVQKQHQLLVTLLLCNAASMEVILFSVGLISRLEVQVL